MNNFTILKRLYNEYTKKFLGKIFLSVFFAILVGLSTSSIAWLLDPAIKKIFIEKNQTLLFYIPILIMIAFATKGASLYIAKVSMIRVAREVEKLLQLNLVKSIVRADTNLIDTKHSGKFISNITFDVSQITGLLSTALLNLFKDSFTLIFLLVVMFYQNWRLSLISIIMIPFAATAAKILGKRMKKVTTEAQEKSGALNKFLVEVFKNHKLIKIFQRETYENERAGNFIEELKEKNRKIDEIFIRSSPVMEALTGIMIAIIIFISGKLIINEAMDINNFFSFLAAMMLAYQPVRSLSTLNMTLKQGLSAAERILPIIDNKNEISDIENASKLKINNGTINFKDVLFAYGANEKNVLKSINLEITGGKMTALVGHSGSGKSTILNLIPRFYNITSGDISIDNQSIYKTKVFSVREKISLVSQDTTLFDDTIKNNIRYANFNATEEEIVRAAQLSHSEEFINQLPNKYDTIIGENGVRLSGGEKQRLSIARAMIKKSQIILLDEATSSLDSETENKIQDALNILIKDRTTVVIAHRLSTILNSDKIYVIDSGNVIASGKHENLLINSKTYKNFYEKQIRKE
jgi:ATP-binding cassette, subfamily B, bacterial MsbA